jgi:hypothetical protein
MTVLMSGTSMPRAATSVATRIDTAVAEGVQGARALALREVAGERQRDEAVAGEPLGQLAGVDTTAHEDDRQRALGHQQQVHERGVPLVQAHQMGDVLDVFVRGAESRAFEVERVALEAVGELSHLRREGCREEMAAVRWQAPRGSPRVLRGSPCRTSGRFVATTRRPASESSAPLRIVIEHCGRRPDDESGLLREQFPFAPEVHAARHDFHAQRGISS